MPLEVMRRLAGDRASDTLRRRILHGGIGRLLDDGLRDLRVSVPALCREVHAHVVMHAAVASCLPIPLRCLYIFTVMIYMYRDI